MHSAFVNVILWTGYLFLVGTLFFIIRNRSYGVIRFFTAYVVVFAVRDAAWFVISNNHAMYFSLWAYYGFWSTEFLLSWLRAFAIAEICWRSLRRYTAVWPLSAALLGVISASLLVWSAVSAAANVHFYQRFVDIGLQRIEFMQTAVILAFMAVLVRYQVPILPLHRWLLIGLGVYSAVQVFNNELGWLEPQRLLPVFDIVRRLAMNVSELIWLYAVAVTARISSPTEAGPMNGELDALAPGVHDRLRELNDRLGEILRA